MVKLWCCVGGRVYQDNLVLGTLAVRTATSRKTSIKKINFCLKLEFKKWLHLFTVSYGATPQLQHNVEEKEALSSKWKLKQFAVAVSVRRRRKLW